MIRLFGTLREVEEKMRKKWYKICQTFFWYLFCFFFSFTKNMNSYSGKGYYRVCRFHACSRCHCRINERQKVTCLYGSSTDPCRKDGSSSDTTQKDGSSWDPGQRDVIKKDKHHVITKKKCPLFLWRTPTGNLMVCSSLCRGSTVQWYQFFQSALQGNLWHVSQNGST